MEPQVPKYGYAYNPVIREFQMNPIKLPQPKGEEKAPPSPLDERGIRARVFQLNKYIRNLRKQSYLDERMRKMLNDYESELETLNSKSRP